MKIISEISPKYSRQLRHTIVEGRDGKFYAILSQQLYDRQPPSEFANYEVAANEVDEKGKFKVLVGIYLKRFFTKEEAVAMHQQILDNFDEMFRIPQKQEASKKTDKPSEVKQANPSIESTIH